MLLTKTEDVHQCEDTDRVYAIVRTRPRATHVVRVGDLAPAGTMLVAPGLYSKALKSQFPKKMVKDIISRAMGWTEKKKSRKSGEKGELLVWTSGFPHLFRFSEKERSLQPKAMITF